jgi:hypothetical protein
VQTEHYERCEPLIPPYEHSQGQRHSFETQTMAMDHRTLSRREERVNRRRLEKRRERGQ